MSGELLDQLVKRTSVRPCPQQRRFVGSDLIERLDDTPEVRPPPASSGRFILGLPVSVDTFGLRRPGLSRGSVIWLPDKRRSAPLEAWRAC